MVSQVSNSDKDVHLSRGKCSTPQATCSHFPHGFSVGREYIHFVVFDICGGILTKCGVPSLSPIFRCPTRYFATFCEATNRFKDCATVLQQGQKVMCVWDVSHRAAGGCAAGIGRNPRCTYDLNIAFDFLVEDISDPLLKFFNFLSKIHEGSNEASGRSSPRGEAVAKTFRLSTSRCPLRLHIAENTSEPHSIFTIHGPVRRGFANSLHERFLVESTRAVRRRYFTLRS